MTRLKKIGKWLQKWDGVWSIPLLCILVIWTSEFLIRIWGPQVGIFPPGLINAAFIAAFYMFAGVTVVNIILNLSDRGPYRYWHNTRPDTVDIFANCKNDFRNLPPWLKFLFYPLQRLVYLVFYFYLVAQLM